MNRLLFVSWSVLMRKQEAAPGARVLSFLLAFLSGAQNAGHDLYLLARGEEHRLRNEVRQRVSSSLPVHIARWSVSPDVQIAFAIVSLSF